MENWRLLLILFLNFKAINEVLCDCILDLKRDFGSPNPVLIRDGEFLAPNTPAGHITMKRLDSVIVACPGKKTHVILGNQTTDVDFVKAVCVSGNIFQVGRWAGMFNKFQCSSQPWFTSQETSRDCYGGNQIIRVGYEVNGVFYKLYEVCFDNNLMTTLYSEHQLTPNSVILQLGKGRRPQFISGQMFGKIRIADVYKTNNQKKRFNQILGADMDTKYFTKNQFLTRGHLSPRADFTMSFASRASFHYANTAPQWMRGNAGDWAALEEALRRHVKVYGGNVTVYTGTFGVSTLQDKQGADREIYLTVDENGNDIVPVPLYFYKLVYDPRKKTATAFVSINSSYYNNTMRERLTFCEDICEDNPKFSWLTWRANDATTSFCCHYDGFVKKIQYLPKLLVTGVFH